MKITIQRDYYRNGQLREELPLVNGEPHGTVKNWHQNGVAAAVTRYRQGLPHGLTRQWNNAGELLGEFRMDQGTGVIRHWHENGQLKAEIALDHGAPSGRTRLFLSDGTLLREHFHIEGRPVTRAAYAKALKQNPQLPRYTGLTRKGYRKPKVAESYIEDLFTRSLLEESKLAEARQWLGAHKRDARRSLGRFRSVNKAMEFVEAVYEAGSPWVFIAEIYGDRKGNEFADVCLIELPKSKPDRTRVRKACGFILKEELGSVTPERDRGESHILIGMW